MKFNAANWSSLWEDYDEDINKIFSTTPIGKTRDFVHGSTPCKNDSCSEITEQRLRPTGCTYRIAQSTDTCDTTSSSFPNNTALPCNFNDHQHNASVTNEQIKNSLDEMSKNENLIGDGTKVHSLPTIRGRHKDLKYITQETLSDVLKNKYSDVIKNFVIIDCRYPYEYEGGHIKEAVNLHTHEMVEQLLSDSKTNEGAVLIFHCEFSSERGPKMLRHLRKMDRKMNAENYPHLCYPEVYLLDGGYRDFFEKDQDNCFPQSYVPMLKKEHASDLRHFRSKSRSWNGFERKKCLRF